jgi:hypothetical protein
VLRDKIKVNVIPASNRIEVDAIGKCGLHSLT